MPNAGGAQGLQALRPYQEAAVREVGLRRLAGPVPLRQHDLALGTVGRALPLHLALQRADLTVLVAAGVLPLQQPEQRLGLELAR